MYRKEYLGKLTITPLDPIGYEIKLGMDNPDYPRVICAYLEDEAFLKFLKKELRLRNFHLMDFGELRKQYPYDCSPRNTKCGCK